MGATKRVIFVVLLLTPVSWTHLAASAGTHKAPVHEFSSFKAKKPMTRTLDKKKIGQKLEAKLQDIVARSGYYGGGIFRIGTSKGPLWEGAYGYIDDSKKNAITKRSTFEIASVTKTFTAAVVLQLVEEKKIDIDDQLEDLLPDKSFRKLLVVGQKDYSGRISVQQLLNHTSGLAHFWDDPPYVKRGYNTFFSQFVKDENRMWKPHELLAFVPGMTPRAKPGRFFHYSDTNYVLLGLIIEETEKKPLHEVFRRRIFEKLRMQDTYLSYKEKPRSRFQESHRFFDDEDLHGKEQWSADWASGGLVSSTRDLETFIFALASNKFFRHPHTLNLMQSWVLADDDMQYGLGIYRIKLDANMGMLWGHDGWGGAFMYYWPEHHIVFTGTTNQTGNEDDETEMEWWALIDEAIKVIDFRSF